MNYATDPGRTFGVGMRMSEPEPSRATGGERDRLMAPSFLNRVRLGRLSDRAAGLLAVAAIALPPTVGSPRDVPQLPAGCHHQSGSNLTACPYFVPSNGPGPQVFTVPDGVSLVRIVAIGGAGASDVARRTLGGPSGELMGNVAVMPNSKLTVYVGQSAGSRRPGCVFDPGGQNGAPRHLGEGGSNVECGGAGGAATIVERGNGRLMVAAGGGGAAPSARGGGGDGGLPPAGPGSGGAGQGFHACDHSVPVGRAPANGAGEGGTLSAAGKGGLGRGSGGVDGSPGAPSPFGSGGSVAAGSAGAGGGGYTGGGSGGTETRTARGRTLSCSGGGGAGSSYGSPAVSEPIFRQNVGRQAPEVVISYSRCGGSAVAVCTYPLPARRPQRQIFMVPGGVSLIHVRAIGAPGGGSHGGYGALVKADLSVTPGQIVDLYVGQPGVDGGSPPTCGRGGGVNGLSLGLGRGGNGGGCGAGGGAATEIIDDATAAPLVVAAGGGGEGYTAGAGGGGDKNKPGQAPGVGGDGAGYADAGCDAGFAGLMAPESGAGAGGSPAAGGGGGASAGSMGGSGRPGGDARSGIGGAGNGRAGQGIGGGGGGGGYTGGGGGGSEGKPAYPAHFCGAGGGAGASYVVAAASNVQYAIDDGSTDSTTGKPIGPEVTISYALPTTGAAGRSR